MLDWLFGNGAYTGFIVVSYGLTFLVLGVLSLILALDLRKQWRALRLLEQETGRRSWK